MYLRMLGKCLQLKSTQGGFVVSKIFEKLVNNRTVDHLEKYGLWLTADLLTVVPYRIAWVFNKSGPTQSITLDILKAFDRVWHAGLLHKLKSYGISGQIFSPRISAFFAEITIWKYILPRHFGNVFVEAGRILY